LVVDGVSSFVAAASSVGFSFFFVFANFAAFLAASSAFLFAASNLFFSSSSLRSISFFNSSRLGALITTTPAAFLAI